MSERYVVSKVHGQPAYRAWVVYDNELKRAVEQSWEGTSKAEARERARKLNSEVQS